MSSSPLKHIAISASAGSGKTYQLVRRFLHLMVMGVEPQRIAAMTFTRKASGEFFNRILNRLAELARGSLKPDTFFEGMTPVPAQWPDFSKLLRDTTEAMQQLRLGTLDSFFANVTACFPLELGLPIGASVMAEQEAEDAREEVISTLIERLFRERDEKAERAIVEAYKQATFGSEEKRAADNLSKWIKEGHDLLLESDGEDAWGQPARIWPKTAAVRRMQIEWSKCLESLERAIVPEELFTAKGAVAWREMVEELRAVQPGLTLPKGAKTLLGKCADVWSDLHSGKATLSIFSNKREVNGMAAQALINVCEAMLARELLVRCQRTQGTAQMLLRYEKEYGQRVRGRGQLSFGDVQRLLARAADAWLQQSEGTSLWYRLDARYDHWLFDEFQDTSFQQWHVMSGLVDEVLQSDGGDRSFFAVGDPKQSIYLWRQAEPRLFQNIMDDSARGIHVEHLYQSRRSAQQVLDAVNGVFGAPDLATLVPGAMHQWKNFIKHESATKLVGYATLMWPDKVEGDQPKTEDVTLSLLRELQPLSRGMSCAVLVRSNTTARELADLIRSELGMEVICESEQHPAIDNAVTLALLSILQLAAHPSDSFALEHLRMTPLGVDDWHATILPTQRLVFETGFTGFVKHWTSHLRSTLPVLDGFTLLRLEQFGDMAAEYDAEGSRDMDGFIRFAKGYRLRTRGGASAIQVMTIHASKGLEFDVVILPFSGNESMSTLKKRSLIAHRNDDGRLDWVLQEPPKDFVELDEVLGAERKNAENRTTFESLCRLYVAMTRAKRGLYLVTDPPAKDGKAVNESFLLRTLLSSPDPFSERRDDMTITRAWECGERQWFESNAIRPPSTPALPAAREPLGILLRERQPMPQRRTPSGEESFKVKGSVLWSTGRDPGRQLGSLVHKMLESVAWIDASFDESVMLAKWQSLGLDRQAAFDKAQTHAWNAIRNPACRAAFTQPGAVSKLWRERPFDLMLGDGQWISGTVDRVNVACDANGKATSATIIDFKTDDVPDDAALAEKLEGYAPQISLYRYAVARLTGLPMDKVGASLLFTRVGRLVPVRPS